ncbi:hypothetical protein BFP97_10055 [Roseivirga sp. 4D4]|uniref:DUF6434 domain-containing protein n=1 Tax=Roseivirga sp. 4D4 TaxID=1889784 RepID=UPI000852BF8A|nr:DUF6434 domain-containing protein [Roseivirga sp. 4D4]OEK01836.1 hypothetical protein BFP97_10055 [Roseivirga sp. 4D4]
MSRPDFGEISSGEEFNTWYWTKEEMMRICKVSSLPADGSKFTLRDRIMYALDNDGKVKPKEKRKKPSSKFNWAKERLTLDTVITDNVSFGPNFRKFMISQVNRKFSFNTDFMDWVKANIGATLRDAIHKWEELEKRKENPNFRREIATHNMLNQYVRDFLNDNPGKRFSEAKDCWNLKRQLPMKDGFVRYEPSDLKL